MQEKVYSATGKNKIKKYDMNQSKSRDILTLEKAWKIMVMNPWKSLDILTLENSWKIIVPGVQRLINPPPH